MRVDCVGGGAHRRLRRGNSSPHSCQQSILLPGRAHYAAGRRGNPHALPDSTRKTRHATRRGYLSGRTPVAATEACIGATMPVEKPFTMPKLGATMTEGTVLRWLYQPGDVIAKGEPLVEIMTDKVNIEVEAPVSGRLVKLLAQDGDILPVGTTLAILADDSNDSNGKGITGDQARRPAPPIASPPAAKREAALHGIALQAVVQTGVRPPLNRDDVIAFVMNTSQHEGTGQHIRQEVRATPIARKIAGEHQIDLARVAERKPGEKVTRA